MRSYSRPLLGLLLRGAARHAAPDSPLPRRRRCTRRRRQGPPPTRRPATASPSPSRRGRPGSTSRTRRRRSIRSWRTSCRRWRRWAPAVAIVDVDADGHADLYVTNSKEGSKNRLYRNQGDGTFEDVAERVGLADAQRAGHRRLDGQRLGRLRQRRLRGPARLQVGPARAVPQRRRQGASRASPSAPACRRGPTSTPPSGSTTTATASSTCSSAATSPSRSTSGSSQTTKIMPESFEYANNGGRKYLFRNLGGGRFEEVSEKVGLERRGAGRWRRSPPTCAAPAIPTCSSPTTTASRSCSSTRAAGSARSGKRDRRRLRAEERHERLGRRRAQPGHVRRLRLEHLRGRHPDPGQQPVGADRRHAGSCRPTRTWPARWASTSAAGASARSSATSTTTASSISTWSTATSRRSKTDSYWYDYSKIAGGHEVVISRRQELAADGDAQPGRLPGEEGVAERRRRPLHRRRADGRRHRSLRRPLGRARRLRQPRRARRRSSPTSAGRCCSTGTTWRPAATGSPST